MDIFLFRRKLKSLGYDLKTLSEILGVSKQVLYLRISGRHILRREHISQIAKAMQLNKDEIISIFFPEL